MNSILVVENESLLLEIYRDTFEKEGYKVLEAFDGATALSCIKNYALDLIILDIKLPDMNGMKVLEEIRKKDLDLPVIVCTAYDAVNPDMEKYGPKKSDYMIKPVVLDDLRERVKKLLSGNGSRKQHT